MLEELNTSGELIHFEWIYATLPKSLQEDVATQRRAQLAEKLAMA